MKKLILDGNDINSAVNTVLYQFVGPLAMASNHQFTIEKLINLLVRPVHIDDYDKFFPELGHENLNLHRWQIEEVVVFLSNRIRFTINQFFGSSIGKNIFSVDMRQDGSIHVIDLGLTSQCRERNSSFEQDILQDIHAGHYVPEKYRRLVGL